MPLLSSTPLKTRSETKPTAPPTVKSSSKLSPIGNLSLYIPLATKSCAKPAPASCIASLPPVPTANPNLSTNPKFTLSFGTYLNKLFKENISEAPIAPPDNSARSSCIAPTSSPCSLANSIFCPCAEIPAGIAKPKAALRENFCDLSNFSAAVRPLAVAPNPASFPAAAPGIKNEANDPSPAPNLLEKASSYPSDAPKLLSLS